MNLNELLAKLGSPIFIRPKKRMTQAELETYLDNAAGACPEFCVRGNADHSEFRGYVVGPAKLISAPTDWHADHT